MSARGRRLWFKLSAHGSTIKVYIVKNELKDDEGNACDSWYDHESRELVVLLRNDESIMRAALLHELLHVCFANHSDDALARVLGDKSREEDVVSFLEPALYGLLANNKLLRIPKAPKW